MVRPIIDPRQLDMYSEPLVNVYRAIEDEIFEMVIDKLIDRNNYYKDDVFRWQVDKMNQLGMINEDTIKILSKRTGRTEVELKKAMNDIGYGVSEGIEDQLSKIYAGSAAVALSPIDTVLNQYAEQQFRDFGNYINETLITTSNGVGSVQKMTRDIINEVTGKVIAGVVTLNDGIVETIQRWGDKGVPSGFIDKGGRTWSVEAYARMAMRSTANRTYNEIRKRHMDDYGVNLVLVSSLSDPREACSHIQGKVATTLMPEDNDTGYPSIYDFGYGEPWGLRGINCRHMFFPYVEGMNINNQPHWSEEEMTHNREVSQKQRYYERQIRKAKRELKIAEESGIEDEIIKSKSLVRKRQAAIRKFVRENERVRFYDREQIIS